MGRPIIVMDYRSFYWKESERTSPDRTGHSVPIISRLVSLLCRWHEIRGSFIDYLGGPIDNPTIYVSQISGGSGGSRGRALSPSGPKSLHFMQFSGKNGQIVGWCPPLPPRGWCPLLEILNPSLQTDTFLGGKVTGKGRKIRTTETNY